MKVEELNKQLLIKLSYVEERAQEVLASKSVDNYTTYVDSALFAGFRSAALSFLNSTFGTDNTYYREFDSKTMRSDYYGLLGAIEILKSLKTEIKNNWLTSLKGIVSAEIFADFFEMSNYLLENGYKDASAVIIGSILEEHLRQLCIKNDIDINIYNDDKVTPKRADRLNSDLYSFNIYNKLDHKNITAWLDLRNNAAHGKYQEYKIEQVKIMYTGVSEFITRNQL